MLLSVLLSYNSDFDISKHSKDGELLMLQRRECTRKYDSSPLRLLLGTLHISWVLTHDVKLSISMHRSSGIIIPGEPTYILIRWLAIYSWQVSVMMIVFKAVFALCKFYGYAYRAFLRSATLSQRAHLS